MTETFDKHNFKITVATAIIVLLFIIATTITTIDWKNSIENKCETLEITHQSDLDAINLRQDFLSLGYTSNMVKIEDLETEAYSRDLLLTEIKTKLANIESLLVDLKQDLKDK